MSFRSLANERRPQRRSPNRKNSIVQWTDGLPGEPKVLTTAEVRELLQNTPRLTYGYSDEHVSRRWKQEE